MSGMNTRLDLVLTITMLVASGSAIGLVAKVWNQVPVTGKAPNVRSARPTPKLPAEPIELQDVATLGSWEAPVVILMFSDFECPFCKRFATDVLPELKKRFVDTGRLLIGFRHLPLAKHTNARFMAEAAECARQQGQFWRFHDELFQSDDRFGIGQQPRTVARRFALDVSRFEKCMVAEAPAAVQRDLGFASKVELSGTPTFLVGKRLGQTVQVSSVMVGARPLTDFEDLMKQMLAVGSR